MHVHGRYGAEEKKDKRRSNRPEDTALRAPPIEDASAILAHYLSKGDATKRNKISAMLDYFISGIEGRCRRPQYLAYPMQAFIDTINGKRRKLSEVTRIYGKTQRARLYWRSMDEENET